jgi:hypothetical protein
LKRSSNSWFSSFESRREERRIDDWSKRWKLFVTDAGGKLECFSLKSL